MPLAFLPIPGVTDSFLQEQYQLHEFQNSLLDQYVLAETKSIDVPILLHVLPEIVDELPAHKIQL